MSGVVGQVESMELGTTLIEIPEDMELNIWTGGKVVTEVQNNNTGVTAKVANRAGCITGITARTAKVGDIQKLVNILQASILSPPDAIVTLANGQKFSAPVVGQWDDGSFHNTGDGKSTFAIYAVNGIFNEVQ